MVNARPAEPGVQPWIAAVVTGLALATLLAAMVAAAPARAQDTGQSQRDKFIAGIFQALDKDKDKSISLEEFKAFGHSEFKAADTNHDGIITQAEFVNARINGKFTDEQMAQIRRNKTIRFVALDLDGDGKLTQAEHDKAGERAFKELDKNGDGKVTLDEMKASRPTQ
ncbi:MAG TPA: EF-hand domain-containing protein [Dongiaceae bacterium]|jgi:Ca2+-binding EF-hand superfamily protein|nr:EF-hand domain-containing protein [Dongiaceae bacterium]